MHVSSKSLLSWSKDRILEQAFSSIFKQDSGYLLQIDSINPRSFRTSHFANQKHLCIMQNTNLIIKNKIHIKQSFMFLDAWPSCCNSQLY
jgi:hypothetical protein